MSRARFSVRAAGDAGAEARFAKISVQFDLPRYTVGDVAAHRADGH
jgi:hypothetical protein